MDKPLSHRKVLIAGASQGIGKGIATTFARAGASLILGGRNVEKLAIVAADLKKETGSQIQLRPGDYAHPADVVRILRDAGVIDILVICYGDTDAFPGLNVDDETWDRLINNNLSGPARLARLVSSGMRDRRQGVILFIGSICGYEVFGAPIGYNVGKAGLRAVVKTMARELGSDNVRVNMISPGNVLFEGGRWAQKRAENPNEIDKLIKTTVPLGRFGTPEDIAQAALFLCSDHASFITGSDLIVDGGQTHGI